MADISLLKVFFTVCYLVLNIRSSGNPIVVLLRLRTML